MSLRSLSRVLLLTVDVLCADRHFGDTLTHCSKYAVNHHRRRRVVRVDRCATVTPDDLHSVDSSRALDLVEPDVARAARRSSPAGHWIGFLPSSDAEHRVLVLQGPGVQNDQTEISVDDVRCHQWLTNRSLKRLCIGDMSPSTCIKYLSLTPSCGSLQCIHDGDQEGPHFCTIEQD